MGNSVALARVGIATESCFSIYTEEMLLDGDAKDLVSIYHFYINYLKFFAR